MLKSHRKALTRLFRFGDLIIICVCFAAAYYFRFGFADQPLALPLQFKIFIVTYFVAWLYLSNLFHLYASKRLANFGQEAQDVGKTTLLSFIVALFPAFFIREFPVSRLFLVYLWFSQVATLLAFRFLLRLTLRYIRRRGYNYRWALIVGQNSRAARLVKGIQEIPELGLKILGFVDAPEALPLDPAFKELPLLDSKAVKRAQEYPQRIMDKIKAGI